MENKKRKMFAAVAVIMLCAVAIVGVGYAYTAQTKNADNNVSTEYITLHQDGTGAYTFSASTNVTWNTTDYQVGSQPTTDFWIDDESLTDTDVNGTHYLLTTLGNPFYVKADKTGGTGTPSTLTCTVNAKNFDYQGDAGVQLFVKVECNNGSGVQTTYMRLTADDTLGTPSFNIGWNGTAYYDATVSVLYGYLKDPGYVQVTHAKGTAPVGPLSNPIANGSLSFSVRTGSEILVTGITLDETALSIAQGGTATLTATLAPGSTTTTKVIWSVSGNEKVTVSDTGVITVDGEAVVNSTATVTATSLDGHFSASCVVTVTAAPGP